MKKNFQLFFESEQRKKEKLRSDHSNLAFPLISFFVLLFEFTLSIEQKIFEESKNVKIKS